MLVDAGSSSNTIGGPVGGARNLISGNAKGVVITGSATTNTTVAGNLIGTDLTGKRPVKTARPGSRSRAAREPRSAVRRSYAQHHFGERGGRC